MPSFSHRLAERDVQDSLSTLGARWFQYSQIRPRIGVRCGCKGRHYPATEQGRPAMGGLFRHPAAGGDLRSIPLGGPTPPFQPLAILQIRHLNPSQFPRSVFANPTPGPGFRSTCRPFIPPYPKGVAMEGSRDRVRRASLASVDHQLHIAVVPRRRTAIRGNGHQSSNEPE